MAGDLLQKRLLLISSRQKAEKNLWKHGKIDYRPEIRRIVQRDYKIILVMEGDLISVK